MINRNDIVRNPYAYLRAIVRKRWLSYVRKEIRRSELMDMFLYRMGNRNRDTSFVRLEAQMILAKLPMRERKIVTLRMSGHTQRDISIRNKCSIGTICKKYNEIICKLRHLYSRRDNERN